MDRDGQDKSCRRKWPRNDKDGAKIGQDWEILGKMGPRWVQDGPKMGPRWSKMEPRRDKMGPRWRQDGPRWDKMGQDATRWANMQPRCSQDGPRWGQDGTKTEPRIAISPAFLLCFFAIPGCRPECAKKWPRNDKDRAKIGQDWARWGQDKPKMGPRWAKMRPRREKMSPRNVAIGGRFAVFAKLGQFRGKEGPIMSF